MKVLSDNTADKLLRLLAGSGTPSPRAVPRPAPTTPPPVNWRLSVVPSTGEVSVGQGAVYMDGERTVVPEAEVGTATENHLVVWKASDGITLEADDWEPDEETGEFRVLGEVRHDERAGFSVRQLVFDPIEISSGMHFGDAEDAAEAKSWSVADETPGILNISDADGNVLAKILVDSRGNIVSWGVADEGGEPDDPTPPKDPPPCGNPINDVSGDDDNPLEDLGGGGGGGGGGGDPQDDHNPLDYEGPGGYTPKCGKAA